jgi:hypothetical protein
LRAFLLLLSWESGAAINVAEAVLHVDATYPAFAHAIEPSQIFRVFIPSSAKLDAPSRPTSQQHIAPRCCAVA